MSGGLPVHVDPRRLAESGTTISGTLPLARLRRLGESLADTQGDVSVWLEFGLNGRGRPSVRGRLSVTVRLVCQRCLAPYELPLAAPVRLTVVRADREAGEMGDEEALVAEEGPIALSDLVEDELILALPQIPTHPWGTCHSADPGGAAPEATGDRQRPFAALAALGRRRGE
jgi:uncharacterized protein